MLFKLIRLCCFFVAVLKREYVLQQRRREMVQTAVSAEQTHAASKGLGSVWRDFIKRIYYLREMSPTGDLVPNLTNELYRFSLEGISPPKAKIGIILQ